MDIPRAKKPPPRNIVPTTAAPFFNAIGPDVTTTVQNTIRDGQELLRGIAFDQGGPSGHTYLLKEVLRTDRWKYKKEHFELNSHRKPRAPRTRSQTFAEEVETANAEFMRTTMLAVKVDNRKRERCKQESARQRELTAIIKQ